MTVEFHRAIPILRMFDVEKAKQFYVNFLGFKIDWEHRFDAEAPLYVQVSRGNLIFHLSEHHDDGSPGTTVFVVLGGLRAFHQEISAKGYRFFRPQIQRVPWNADLMEVQDPFGNRIRFNEYRQAKESRRQVQTGKKVQKKNARKPAGSRP